MNKITLMKKAAAVATMAALLAPSFVLAQVNAAVSADTSAGGAAVSVKIAASTERARGVGEREIDRRVVALNALVARVNDLKRLNADAKTSVTTSLNQQVTGLTALRAKIVADTDDTTLKADVQSVTQAYRIFALVMPQGRIVVMADTSVYVADALLTVGAKLDARIKAVQATGKDVTTLNTQLVELGTKATDAKTQAQDAITLIASLQPDNGDKTLMASNTKALTDARAKLKVGMDDLKTARSDAGKIVATLKTMPVAASAGAGASAGTGAAQ